MIDDNAHPDEQQYAWIGLCPEHAHTQAEDESAAPPRQKSQQYSSTKGKHTGQRFKNGLNSSRETGARTHRHKAQEHKVLGLHVGRE